MSFLAHKQMKTNFARETAQQVEILATKPNGLSSIPGLHMVEGETLYPQIVLGTSTGTHSHTYKRNKCKKNVALNLTNRRMTDGVREVNLPFNVLCEVSTSNVS